MADYGPQPLGSSEESRFINGRGNPTSKLMHRLTICLVAVGVLTLATSANATEPGTVPGTNTSCVPGTPEVIIYHAGALTTLFLAVESVFSQQTGVCVTDVSAGSVDAARRVTTGGEACDIFASADFEDIDLLLKPAGAANYNLLFGTSGMVLAYKNSDKNTANIAAPGNFNPPGSVPQVADNWEMQLIQSGVTVGGTHPFLDPSGYRANMIFQLTEQLYNVPNLYDLLLDHYAIVKANDVLGATYDYQLIYDFSALAAFKADTTNTYRYARLPDEVNLSNPQLNLHHQYATTTIPGLRLPDTANLVTIPATRVVFSLTILNGAPNPTHAIKFLQLLFSPQGVALQTPTGPTPISPPIVSAEGFAHLPSALRSLVRQR
jgi:ABC-type molybdate transport system substrate-binding protein